MMGIGYIELLILGLVGLGCVGVVAAIAFAATLGGRRGEQVPHQPVVRCTHCGAVHPASDQYCGACGQPLAPEK